MLTCDFDWDGGGAGSSEPVAGGVCSATNTFTQAGVYTVTVTASDDDGGSASDSVVIVVYDPAAGFVSGGGTIDSPAGSFPADPSAEGKAHFSFEAKYKKNATTPKGQNQFHLVSAGFKFKGSVYEWLVVAGAKTQAQGTGEVDGVSGYRFLLTATDGQVSGGGGFDLFRLKVWEIATDTVVYDNAMGSPDDMDVANPQEIESGSIVIHRGY